MGFFSWLFKRSKPKKIKMGIALGSGGAKGFAHLGVLKALEENGISFDYIAGTSIGSIVGACVAQGYSSTDIFELLKTFTDMTDVKNIFMLNTSVLAKVLDNQLGSVNFEEMKKPFKAVATELDTGKEHVFDKGNVAMALCASSSMQPYFKPVVIDGVRYIDGAYTNSIPADVVKDMGADYIIGVDLSTREQKPSIISKIFPTYKSNVKEPWAKGYKFSNLTLHPDLSGYTSVSISSSNQMFDIGYNCAMKAMPQIIEEINALTYGKKTKKK